MWEYDSNMDITYRGETRSVQVWSRISRQWPDTRAWTFTEDVRGKENSPKNLNCGHYTSTESFAKQFPNFNRKD
jgi:hypothetical protein